MAGAPTASCIRNCRWRNKVVTSGTVGGAVEVEEFNCALEELNPGRETGSPMTYDHTQRSSLFSVEMRV